MSQVAREVVLGQLAAVLPEIAHGRETHRQWANARPEDYAANPRIGDAAFHRRTLAEYDARLKAIRDAIEYLTSPPEDGAAVWIRAWRNRFISERTGFYQREQAMGYELATAHAESDANTFADAFQAAIAKRGAA